MPESVKIMVFSTKNAKKIFWGGGIAPSPLARFFPSGEGDIPSPLYPRRLRHLDPSHSKILGTPLTTVGLPY